MNRSLIKYILFFSCGIGLMILVNNLTPKPIDWNETYNINDKIPYGLYIFNQEFDEYLKPKKVEKFTKTPYEYYKENFDSINPKKETWLFIEKSIDYESQVKMYEAVEKGVTLFISSQNMPRIFLDTLNIDYNLANHKTILNLTNKNLASYKFPLEKQGHQFYFYDATHVEVLGNNGYEPNFIRKKVGKGTIYLHLNPEVFTNYNLLKSNTHFYTEGVLSYINQENIIWFNDNEEIAVNENTQSPLRFILKNPALRWSWYLFLLGTLFFIIFNAKRKQRVVPVITPKENKSVEFAKTIANLYYQEKNHTDLIQKMIVYFLEDVRTKYRLDTSKLNQDFCLNLSKKTNKPLNEVTDLIDSIIFYKENTQKLTEKDLINLHSKIEKITR